MSIINRRNTSSRNFVEKWEDLPSGDWLDTDEYGTHWYLANDGTHWFSTDEGYEVWVDEDEKVVEDHSKSQGITNHQTLTSRFIIEMNIIKMSIPSAI